MKHFGKWLRLTCCVLAVVAMTVVAPASALASFSAVVTSSSMRVYAACSVNSASATLPKGTVVTVKAYSDGIAKISYKGKTGYARVSDMKAVESGSSSSSSSGTSTKVSTSGAKAYKKASTSAQSVSVPKGTAVSVLSTSGNWAKVERKGYTAWMKKSDLALFASSSSSSSSSGSKADQVIAAAKDKMGCEYVYGKSGPDTFDCAGLVKYAYKQVGVSLSGSAKGQGYNAGTKVSYSELQAGDIVCFDTVEDDSDLSDHTGIYLGGGKFIHCSSAAGEVIVSSLSSGYYNRVFSWGRRVL